MFKRFNAVSPDPYYHCQTNIMMIIKLVIRPYRRIRSISSTGLTAKTLSFHMRWI